MKIREGGVNDTGGSSSNSDSTDGTVIDVNPELRIPQRADLAEIDAIFNAEVNSPHRANSTVNGPLNSDVIDSNEGSETDSEIEFTDLGSSRFPHRRKRG